jgi:hypothetical protein
MLSQDVKVMYACYFGVPMEAFTEQHGDYASAVVGFVCHLARGRTVNVYL